MTNCIKKRPKTILPEKNKIQSWREYVQEILSNRTPNTPPEEDENINEEDPEITKEEVIDAIKSQKEEKATGPDNIQAVVIQLIAEQDGKERLQLIISIFNTIYRPVTIAGVWRR